MKFASDKSITEEFIQDSYHGRCESLIYFVRGPGETSGDLPGGSQATNYNLLLWDPSELHYDYTLTLVMMGGKKTLVMMGGGGGGSKSPPPYFYL